MKITKEIVRTLASGYVDDFDIILEEQGIAPEELNDEEVESKATYILDQFEYLDEETTYVDLEKGYEDITLYYKYAGKCFSILYTYYGDGSIEPDMNSIVEVEPFEVTVTRYRIKNEAN